MAMFGAILFLVGLVNAGPTLREHMDKAPPSWGLMMLGVISFALFFPISYIVYLAKELQKTKERVEELASRQL